MRFLALPELEGNGSCSLQQANRHELVSSALVRQHGDTSLDANENPDSREREARRRCPKTLLSSTEVPVDFLWGGRWRHVFPQNALPVAFLSFILGMHLVCMGLKRRPCPQGCDRQEPWGITRQEQV